MNESMESPSLGEGFLDVVLINLSDSKKVMVPLIPLSKAPSLSHTFKHLGHLRIEHTD